jgi:hypothetical protein
MARCVIETIHTILYILQQQDYLHCGNNLVYDINSQLNWWKFCPLSIIIRLTVWLSTKSVHHININIKSLIIDKIRWPHQHKQSDYRQFRSLSTTSTVWLSTKSFHHININSLMIDNFVSHFNMNILMDDVDNSNIHINMKNLVIYLYNVYIYRRTHQRASNCLEQCMSRHYIFKESLFSTVILFQ